MRDTTTPITIRRAHPEEPGVLRIAALDSARVPSAPLLVAEADGQVRAVRSIHGDDAIADPFFATTDLLELLDTHADRIGRFDRPSLLQRLGLRARAAY
ncbi:MAG TPA: hypothetical protein VGF74_18385 [Thermoleophilaceae bacterium]|jgi:hypothetical protein